MTDSYISLLLLNTSGLRPKFEMIKTLLWREKTHYALLTVTWVKPGQSTPPEIVCQSVNQSSTSRGFSGTALLAASSKLRTEVEYLDADQKNGRYLIFRISGVVFVLVYLSPELDDDVACEILLLLHKTLSRMQARHVVFCGDFNCHNLSFGSPKTDNRGKKIAHIMEKDGFKLANQIGDFSYHRPGSAASMLDLIWVRGIEFINTPKTRRDVYVGNTEHFPIMFSIKKPRKYGSILNVSKETILTKHIEQEQRCSQYRKVISQGVCNLKNAVDRILDEIVGLSSTNSEATNRYARNIDQIDNQFHSMLISNAKTIFGVCKTKRNARNFNVHPKILYRCNLIQSLYKLSIKIPGNQQLKKQIEKNTKLLNSECWDVKKKSFEQFSKEISKKSISSQQKAIKMILKAKNKKENTARLKNDEESLLYAVDNFQKKISNQSGDKIK